MVDHEGNETEFAGRNAGARQPVVQLGTEEDGLASVGIGNPAVEGEYGEKLVGIGYLIEQDVRDKIVNRHGVRVAGMPGAEVPAGADQGPAGAHLQMDLGIRIQKTLREADYLVRRRIDL